jgi:hypothetical protein
MNLNREGLTNGVPPHPTNVAEQDRLLRKNIFWLPLGIIFRKKVNYLTVTRCTHLFISVGVCNPSFATKAFKIAVAIFLMTFDELLRFTAHLLVWTAYHVTPGDLSPLPQQFYMYALDLMRATKGSAVLIEL